MTDDASQLPRAASSAKDATSADGPTGHRADDLGDQFADVGALLDEATGDDRPDDDAAADDAAADGTVDPGPPTGGEQTTEWFNVDDFLALDDAAPALPRRRHLVTTVVVSHDGAVWLPAVLTTLAAQTRLPDVAIGVDTGSTDDSAALLRASFGPDRTVDVPAGTGFGAAVAAGLEQVGPEPFPGAAIEWLWLLHDDSAPSPDCLAALLDTADDHPSAAILGPKVLGWHDRRLLLEAGVTIDAAGRRVTGLERREHDQGQHDGVRDVLAVSSAGMLVRRDVWDALAGFDPDLPLFRDDLDFCWRAHRRGERVLVATDAVVHHREASAHGRRVAPAAPRPHRADREASAHVLLAHASSAAAPFVALRLLAGSAFRSGLYLLGKDVAAARDEVGAVAGLVFHPARVRRSRALVDRTTVDPAGVVRSLRPSTTSQIRHGLEALGGMVTTSGSTGPSTSISALDSGPVGDDADFLVDSSGGLVRRVLTTPAILLGLALTVLAVIGARGLWLGDGVLQGGALLPAPPGAGDLWATYQQAWHDVGPGSSTAAPAYLALVAAVATVLLGKASAAVTLLLVLALPLAGWSAYVSLRGLVPGRAVRVWAAAAYALLPSMTGAVAAGRIGTTIAAIALPLAMRSLVRIAGPGGTMRRAGGTAILVAIVLATAPAVWLVLALAGALVVVVGVRRSGASARWSAARLGIGLLAPVVVLLPWSGRLFVDPALWLLEPGLSTGPVADPNLRPWHVLLLHPGGPGMTPVWLTVGIVLAGLLALLLPDRLQVTGRLAAFGGLALAIALVQSAVLVTVPGTTMAVRPWPGQTTLAFGAALIAMAAVGADGLRDRLIGTSFTLGQPVVFLGVLKEFHVALDDLGKGQFAPAPESRRRGTGDARNRRGAAGMLNGDAALLIGRERRGAIGAIRLAGKQLAGRLACNILRRLDFAGQFLGDLLDIGAAERGDRNGLFGVINGDRFERRFFRQRSEHRTGKTGSGRFRPAMFFFRTHHPRNTTRIKFARRIYCQSSCAFFSF